MNRFLLRRLILTDCEGLLDALSHRQHVSPHESVETALSRTVEQLRVCPQAIEHALQWLQLDRQTRIGRLRRTELTQLARTVHRFWRQRAAASFPPTDPSEDPSAAPQSASANDAVRRDSTRTPRSAR